MSRIHTYVLFLILIFINILLEIHSDSEKNESLNLNLPPRGFGKFIVKIRHIEECKNPGIIDKKNKYDFDIKAMEYNETDELLSGYIYVRNKIKIIKGKITPYVRKNGVTKVTHNITTTVPCKDPIMTIPLKTVVYANNLCVVNAKNYSIQNVDINKMVHTVVGSNFLYERLEVYYEYFSKWGSVFCVYLIIDTMPYPK